MSVRISLLGLPTDVNSSHLRGPATAPAAIRASLTSGSSNMWSENGWDLESDGLLRDRGDAALTETPADLDGIADAAAGLFADGPAIFLGGDHFVTWPILEGLRCAGHPPRISCISMRIPISIPISTAIRTRTPRPWRGSRNAAWLQA